MSIIDSLLNRTKPKIKVLKLFLDNTFSEIDLPFSVNKIKDEGDQGEITFDPTHVYTERPSKLIGLPLVPKKKPRKIVLVIDGKVTPLKFSKTTKNMQVIWTKQEAKEFVKKETAKSLMEFKPLTWTQFIIFMIPIALLLLVSVKVALHVGAF